MHSPIRPNPLETPTWLRWLTAAALVLLLAVTLSRATMHENLRDAMPVNPGDPATVHDAGPATGLLIDLVLILPAMLILLRASLDGGFRIRFHLSHGLFLAFAAWAWISTFWADDQFNAIVNATHLLAAAAAMWAATQLFRDGVRLRLLAATCGSVLLIYTANGLIYRLIEVPENLHYWQEHKTEELTRRGWRENSFEAIQFEKKLTSGEMIGFSTSPNTFAATLVLVSILVVGTILQRIVNRDESGWPIVLALPLLPAAWILTLTQSKAALTAPFLAALLLIVIGFFGRMLRQRIRLTYAAALTGAAGFIGLTVAYGLSHRSLPSASLAFRWNYWIGGWRIFIQHPWIGVGWTSFASRYLAVRVPVAAEEVKDPHNFLVRSFVELGIIGGLITVGWVARLVWEMLYAKPQRDEEQSFDRRQTAGTIIAIAGLAFVFGIFAAVDLTSSGTNAWFILLQVLQRLLYFGLILLAFATATLQSSTKPVLDDRPAPWIARAAAVAVGVFLIQNLIDFSLFEPGSMTLFAIAAGASIARFGNKADGPSRPIAALSLTALVAAAIALVAGVWLPIAVAESRADIADDAIRDNNPFSGSERLKQAFDGLWIRNADYAFRAALAIERVPGVSPAQVLPLLQAAADANPMDPQIYRNRGSFLALQPNPDGKQIIDDYTRAAQLDPNEVALHLEFADALDRLGQHVRAREERQLALKYNDLLNPDEPKRLSPDQVVKIQQQIDQAG